MRSPEPKKRLNILSAIFKDPNIARNGITTYIYNHGCVGKLPSKYAFSLFKEDNQTIQLQKLSTRLGSVTIEELCILCMIVKKNEPKRIFEFGTLDGRTTLNIAINSPEDCEICTLDIPIKSRKQRFEKRNLKGINNGEFKEEIGTFFLDQPVSKKITQLIGDSINYDFSPYYGKIDFVFIDANHNYEYVKADTMNSLKMLTNRGTIIWHDYPNFIGVQQLLNELFDQNLPVIHISNTRLAYFTRSLETR